jgi:hypothetical protein
VTDDHFKIHIDATRPATLNDGTGQQSCQSLARTVASAKDSGRGQVD